MVPDTSALSQALVGDLCGASRRRESFFSQLFEHLLVLDARQLFHAFLLFHRFSPAGPSVAPKQVSSVARASFSFAFSRASATHLASVASRRVCTRESAKYALMKSAPKVAKRTIVARVVWSVGSDPKGSS